MKRFLSIFGAIVAAGVLLGSGVPSRTLFGSRVAHGSVVLTCQTATDDYDIDLSLGNIFVLDLDDCDQDANDINAPTNAVEGMTYTLFIECGATEDLTWNAAYLWTGGGTPPTTTQSDGVYDIASCIYANSAHVCSSVQNGQ